MPFSVQKEKLRPRESKITQERIRVVFQAHLPACEPPGCPGKTERLALGAAKSPVPCSLQF